MASRYTPRVLFNRRQIAAAIAKLAEAIKRDYQDKHPVIICILKGSFVFTADLVRQLDFPLEVEFIRLSSYGRGQTTEGRISLVQRLHLPIKDRHVLVMEDIVDTGGTVAFVMAYLQRKKPASLRLCALADKPSRREVPVKIDYLGFKVPNRFIVGYGLDWDEKYRHLPDICFLEEE